MQPSSSIPSSRFRVLLPLAMGLLVLVSVSSLVDIMVGSLPTAFGDIRWRYQLMFSLLSSGTQVALFVALFMILGALADYRIAVRGAAIAAVAFGVLYLVILPFYSLDFVVARRLIQVNSRHAFDMTWAKTTGYMVVLTLVMIWAGVRGFLNSTNLDPGGKKREVGEGLIVGQG